MNFILAKWTGISASAPVVVSIILKPASEAHLACYTYVCDRVLEQTKLTFSKSIVFFRKKSYSQQKANSWHALPIHQLVTLSNLIVQIYIMETYIDAYKFGFISRSKSFNLILVS